MLRLSFIVPFYDVEPYIEECIRSLYHQDIPKSEYEVICVDDCSPDGSRAIVERLQKEYPTLRLLTHTTNKRQGGARNTGLREACGRYIWFVDADDYIKPNCLNALLTQAEKENLDLLKFYYEQVPNRLNNKLVSSSVVTGTELVFEVDTGEAPMVKCCVVWNQLIKRKLIETHNIAFAENVQYEDDDYVYQLYVYANRAMVLSEKCYFLRQTPNSTTRRKNDLRRAMDMYAQTIRFTELAPKLATIDKRWDALSKQRIKDEINNQVLSVLNDCSLWEQIYFWLRSKHSVRKLKLYVGHRTYAKLSSFLMWKMLN